MKSKALILGTALALLLPGCSDKKANASTSGAEETQSPQSVEIEISDDATKDGKKMVEQLLECVNNDQPEKIRSIVESFTTHYADADEGTKYKFLVAFQRAFNQLSDTQYLAWVKMVNAYQSELGDIMGSMKTEIETVEMPWNEDKKQPSLPPEQKVTGHVTIDQPSDGQVSAPNAPQPSAKKEKPIARPERNDSTL